jgi:hypothetical protein
MWDSIADKSNRKRKEKKITVISERKANGHGRSGRHMRKPGTFSKTAFQNRLLTKTTEMPLACKSKYYPDAHLMQRASTQCTVTP